MAVIRYINKEARYWYLFQLVIRTPEEEQEFSDLADVILSELLDLFFEKERENKNYNV